MATGTVRNAKDLSDSYQGTVRLWDMNTGTCIQKFQQPKILPRNERETNEGIERIEVVDKIVLAGGKLLTLWDLDSGDIRGWITPKDVLIGFKVDFHDRHTHALGLWRENLQYVGRWRRQDL